MVVEFRKMHGSAGVHQIDKDTVESLLGRNAPWWVEGRERGDETFFAVCPYCDNPIQLKALYRRTDASPRAYGSHVGKPVTGFNYDPSIECAYNLKNRSYEKVDRRAPSELGQKLVRLAVLQFDRVIATLSEDIGFWPSRRMALNWLRVWLTGRGFDYEGAHLRNLPWMIAYMAKAENLFGERIGQSKDLKIAVGTSMPWARIDEWGRLVKGSRFTDLRMQFLHHRFGSDPDGPMNETLRVRVQDFSNTIYPDQAPTLLDQIFALKPERFERLIALSGDHPKRDRELLSAARALAEREGFSEQL